MAEESAAAIAGKDVEVLINVVMVLGRSLVAAGWLGAPNLGWDVDEEGGGLK